MGPLPKIVHALGLMEPQGPPLKPPREPLGKECQAASPGVP